MGLRGPGAKRIIEFPARSRRKPWEMPGLSRAKRIIKFIESLTITSGMHAGRKFILRPWQRKIIESWYYVEKCQRKIRTGLLSMGRKNGKTSLVAAIALAHLLGPETEQRGQVIAAAADSDQSGLIFDELCAFINAEDYFLAKVNIKNHSKIIENLENGTRFKSLSSDAKKTHGLSPSVLIIDELAQWGYGEGLKLYNALVTATGARKEPLTLIISTQAADDHALMSELVDYGKQVRAGIIDDPSFSAHIFEVPLDANIWDEEMWMISNPALGDFRSFEEMRIFADRAKRMHSLKLTFQNLYLNQRIRADETWISLQLWMQCEREFAPESLIGKRCYGALDLSEIRDLTAFALFFPDDAELMVWTWCPKEALDKREDVDRVPYRTWSNLGFIEPTSGRAINKRFVALRIAELNARFKPEKIGYDRWGMPEFERILSEEGIDLPLQEFGQGYKSMAPAMKAFEELVLNGKLNYQKNPVLTWAMSNIVPERDAAGNLKPSKNLSRDRIDPLVASIMAVGIAVTSEPKQQYITDELIIV